MSNKSQAVNEIPAITRHLKDKGNNYFAVFIAPYIHADSTYMINFSKTPAGGSVNIYSYTILDFVQHLKANRQLESFVK